MCKQPMIHTALRCIALATFMAGLLCAFPVQADFHLVKITEVMAGANGDATIQFVEIEITQGQNCQGTGSHPNPGDPSTATCVATGLGAKLVFFDASGNNPVEFIFPDNLPNFDAGRSILIATQAFADLGTTPTPDFIMPVNVVANDGKVCYKNRASAPFPANLCLSYGNFTGNTEGFGTPAAALPTTGCSSLKRVADAFPPNNATEFAPRTPAPRNNAGTTGTVNCAPVADPQSVTTGINAPINITLTGSDLDSDPLTLSIDTGPANGGLTGTPPNVTYTPNLDFAGPDSFTFKVNDSAQDSAPATVSITVISLGHFLCYKTAAARAALGQPPFPTFLPQVVTLEDQFETKLTNVGKLTGLCNPADKNNEGVIDPNTHLTAFGIKDGKTDPPQLKLVGTQHIVVNQFGTLVVSVTKMNRLLVPSSKSLGETPPLPLGSVTVDHFKCYEVKVAKAPKGQPPFPTFTPLDVTLEDQFGLRVFTATKPSLLCNPVDKNGEGILRPDDILMCYQIKLASTMPPQPEFTPTRVSATNQFGSGVLDATATESLCVPSQKDPP